MQSNNDLLEKEFEQLGEKLDYLNNRRTELVQEVTYINELHTERLILHLTHPDLSKLSPEIITTTQELWVRAYTRGL